MTFYNCHHEKPSSTNNYCRSSTTNENTKTKFECCNTIALGTLRPVFIRSYSSDISPSSVTLGKITNALSAKPIP